MENLYFLLNFAVKLKLLLKKIINQEKEGDKLGVWD